MRPVGQGENTDFCNMAGTHFDGEIYSPPYLFNDDRAIAPHPTISSLSSNIDSKGFEVKVGGKLTVDMNNDGDTTFSLLRLGSAAHSNNTDQRRVPLANVKNIKARHVIILPGDASIVLPGYYYLFAMNKAGTPCIARTVQVVL
ncbi:hypothetical protein BDZ85DRAFT_52898 [Elsinoe ampelina]|uniref:Galactose oxidase-like Early set domain-containing protein n=1 Tax=Elsinoe ampelina TaxID=302913 RepID=A0A6A6GM04_9PEZI|nr:hypothetical protein BDZ85DRAFT_52898 [Elsinoe ampelina]